MVQDADNLSVVDRSVSEVVEATVRERLGDAAVSRIQIAREEDFDGDAVLVVTVVLDSKAKKLDASRISGLARHLRSNLNKIQENSFPLVSIISNLDAKKARVGTI